MLGRLKELTGIEIALVGVSTTVLLGGLASVGALTYDYYTSEKRDLAHAFSACERLVGRDAMNIRTKAVEDAQCAEVKAAALEYVDELLREREARDEERVRAWVDENK